MKNHPLVSILIPNYNYARYLDSCLESALNQTYDNLEVVFVDNHSSDESYDIAMSYRSRYKDRIRVYRNDENIGGSANHKKAQSYMDPRTKCFIYLSSDDYYHPTLVERSMDIMDRHPSVGFVIVHRNSVDENGIVTEEIPFYNTNCVIPGAKQMEVFMMAGVGVSTQCFRNRQVEFAGESVRSYRFDIAGDWFSNFCLASVADMGYISDPLCMYRTHSRNVTSGAVTNLTNSIEHILLIHAFSQMAKDLGVPGVSRRLRPGLEKLGNMCLRYCTQLLVQEDVYTAKRYLHLATVLKADISQDDSWRTLWRLSEVDTETRRMGLLEFEKDAPQRRLVSYDPPQGSILI